MSPKILIVDDEQKIRNILTQILIEEGYTVQTAENGEKGIELVDSFLPELVLMDQNMAGINGIEATERIKEKYPTTTIIMLTAYGSIPQAVDAIKKGAYDYLSKPFDNEKLLILIRRALEHNRLTGEVLLLKKQLQDKFSFKNIIGISSKMQHVFEQMRRVCETNATVLIQGESGTGKELIAKAIHYHSQRSNKPLIAINCGAIPITLLESELFGHEKGAYTDAKERKIGKFEQAHGGTLFLDEIGELSHDAQVKLLRVLDDKKISRIGGSEEISVDVRFIAATNKELQEEIRKEKFRLDLFYRLNIFTISVPPLRERKEDIPSLVEHFIDKYNKQIGIRIKSISKDAVNYLQNYHWPGNIRDLENAIQSAMILSKYEIIQTENLPLRIFGYPEPTNKTDLEVTGLENYMKQLNGKIEKDLIIKTLTKCNDNRTKTAHVLKISRKTLFNKMKEYGLK